MRVPGSRMRPATRPSSWLARSCSALLSGRRLDLGGGGRPGSPGTRRRRRARPAGMRQGGARLRRQARRGGSGAGARAAPIPGKELVTICAGAEKGIRRPGHHRRSARDPGTGEDAAKLGGPCLAPRLWPWPRWPRPVVGARGRLWGLFRPRPSALSRTSDAFGPAAGWAWRSGPQRPGSGSGGSWVPADARPQGRAGGGLGGADERRCRRPPRHLRPWPALLARASTSGAGPEGGVRPRGRLQLRPGRQAPGCSGGGGGGRRAAPERPRGRPHLAACPPSVVRGPGAPPHPQHGRPRLSAGLRAHLVRGPSAVSRLPALAVPACGARA